MGFPAGFIRDTSRQCFQNTIQDQSALYLLYLSYNFLFKTVLDTVVPMYHERACIVQGPGKDIGCCYDRISARRMMGCQYHREPLYGSDPGPYIVCIAPYRNILCKSLLNIRLAS